MINESLNVIQRLCYFGIGLVANLERTAAEIGGEIEVRYLELVARGAQDHSELAQNLRNRLDNGILTVRDFQGRIPGLTAF